MAGRVFHRCTACRRTVKHRRCENPDCTGTRVVWAFAVDVGHGGDGKRRQVLRSGFESKEDAEEALADLLAARRAGYTPTRDLTVAGYLLDRWLPRTRTSEKTRHDRETHMRAYVTPRIGMLQLQAVTGDHLTEMYDDLAARGRTRRPDPELGWGLSPTTIRRIHTQLHKAFADAVRWGLLQHNPCDRADPPSTNEVKARALASRQVFDWSQLQRFVDTARGDRLYAMWHLFAVTGMRRSEMAALRWAHVDLEARMISVVRVAIEDGGQVIERMLPKSSSSRRAIELDDYDVEVLRQHRKRQLEERLQAGAAWHDDDLAEERWHHTVIVHGKGDKDATIPLAPRARAAVEQAVDGRDDGPLLRNRWGNRMSRNNVAAAVATLATRAGIARRMTPHTLRHAAITAALNAGAHLRDVQDFARHADPKTTMRYDRNRHSLDRHATYAIAQYIAGSE